MSPTDNRNALVCLVISTAAFLATGPIAQMPFQDDWSYAFSARQCALTGRMTYNGWATAIILPHTYWGALFIRLFGFSFTVLRFSTLPWAAGSVVLSYLLARQAGLRPATALFTAMLLGLSPLFLPVATSFMVDVPGLFFMLLSLFALIHAAQSERWIFWLGLGAAAGMIGGMNRQIAWIVPLALLPYLAILHHANRRFLLCAAGAWLLIVAAVSWSMRWFGRQPLALPDMGFAQLIDALQHPLRTGLQLAPLGLTLVMVILPAALPVIFAGAAELWRGRAGRAGAITAVFCTLLAVFLLRNPRIGLEPWMPITLTTCGVMDGLELSGHRPVAQPLLMRSLLSAAVFAAIALLASRAAARASPRMWRSWRSFWFPRDGRIAAPALLLFAVGYSALLIPRAEQNWLSDRYALPLIPVAAIFLLRRSQNSASAPAVTAAWILLAAYALFAVASTQDVLALARARGVAVRRLTDAGVPPTAIAAGLEYDRWAQLLCTGFINDYRIPSSLFKPDVGLTPSLRPLYRLEFEGQADTGASRFGDVQYFSTLPPFHRRIFIDRFKNPWWADPQQVYRRPYPPPHEFESYFDGN